MKNKSRLLTKASLLKLKRFYRSLYFAPCVVFAAMVLITYWSWSSSLITLRRDNDSALIDKTTRIQDLIVQRLGSYEQILTGGAGLVRASQTVSVNEWHDYVATFDIDTRYRGVKEIGYIKAFRADELQAVTEFMQAQGINDFQVKPAGPRDFYTAILYQDPMIESGAIGVDMFTEKARMKTMELARDSGQAAITPPLTPLLPGADKTVLLLYTPQYQSGMRTTTTTERQQALRGYVYARVVADDFFNTILTSSIHDNSLGLRISTVDTAEHSPTYQSPRYNELSSQSGNTTTSQKLELYGQTWLFDYVYKTSSLTKTQRRATPQWTVVAGLLFGFLLAEIVYLLLSARSRELSNQSKKEIDLAKDDLLSLASHQLRTPATTVKQYLGMVLQGFSGDITDTQQSLLSKAYAGNERQLYIINEMLHLAKIDSGRIVLAKHPTDITKLIKEILVELGGDIEAAGHKVVLKLPKKPISLSVDGHMLRMSIENLISNAVKYTPQKGKISISLVRATDRVEIVVTDTGVGIDQKDLPKLYTLFTRIDNELTSHVNGTGVGLYLAKHLVELHNGQLYATSKAGSGSTFTISLPNNSKKS